MEMLEAYLKEMFFEEITFDDLNKKRLELLNEKEGLIIHTDNTSLWVLRKLSVQSILNTETVMESLQEFTVMDSFGVAIWSGDSESVIEYVDGFVNGPVEEESVSK
jgi:hypothetical protein